MALTATRLRQVLDYDRETGIFTWLVCPALVVPIGSTAGAKHHAGYVCIKFKGRTYPAHRLAWLYVHDEWPPEGMDIDHINGDRADNRIANLRPATRSQNCMNRKHQINNTSGATGVVRLRGSKWVARVSVDGKYKHLGVFSRIEDAVAARQEAATKHYGEFARDQG